MNKESVIDEDYDSDLCSLLSYKSFLDGPATATPPPTPAVSQPELQSILSPPLPPVQSIQHKNKSPPSNRKSRSIPCTTSRTTSCKTPRQTHVMKNTVITVNVTGPGKLAMTTPHQEHVIRKTRPKAAYQHGDPFTTGLEQTSSEDLQELFPPPIGFHTLPTVQSLTQPVSYSQIQQQNAPSQSPDMQNNNDKKKTEDINETTATPMPTSTRNTPRCYYRYYPGADMTEQERNRLGYTPRNTPTITKSVDGRRGQTPNRWRSAVSMRSMDYHLAELSLYYRGAHIAAPNIKSLKSAPEAPHRRPATTASYYQQHHLGNNRPDTREDCNKPRRPSDTSQQFVRSGRPSSYLSERAEDDVCSLTPISVSQRQFRKRNQLLREQMEVYIQWKTAEQIKERERLAKRPHTATTATATPSASQSGRRSGSSILRSGKEKRLLLFNNLLRQQEAEYASEIRQNEELLYSPGLEEDYNPAGGSFSSNEDEYDEHLDKEEQNSKKREEEEEEETIRDDGDFEVEDNKLTEMWQMLQ